MRFPQSWPFRLALLFTLIWTIWVGYWWVQTPLIGTGDAASYVCSAQSIMENGFFPGEWYPSGFGFSLLIAALHLGGMEWVTAARLLSFLLGAAAIPLAGAVLSRFFQDDRAYVLVLPLFLLPEYIHHALLGYVGTVSFFFLFASLFLLQRAQDAPHERKDSSLWQAAGLFGFSLWTRLATLAFLPFFWTKTKNIPPRKKTVFGAIILFFALLFFVALAFNQRDDTSLRYLSVSDFANVIIPNAVMYLLQISYTFPFLLFTFLLWPLALKPGQVKDMLWWFLPSILFLLLFPLGNNLYYVFPLLPFFLVAGFKSVEGVVNRIHSPQTGRMVLLVLLILQFLWLAPALTQVGDRVYRYQDFHAGFQYIQSNAPADALIITGREGESMGVFFQNWGSCDQGNKPEMLVHPYTVTHLFNNKDMNAHRAYEEARLQTALNSNRTVWITSEAYWFAREGWCPVLDCIPLPEAPTQPIWEYRSYAIYSSSIPPTN
ncbi:MAG: hypothetical protein Q8P05_03200 [Candidatus Diapherotrites archaeon]|nr:hypothetical protein [Candidatus Diapherotrites archaeon]MDZ4256381.1 hypothetical protein [archaeon]